MNQIVQGTPEWVASRLGLVTASRIADVLARTKSGYSASRANYMVQLVAERLTGEAAETYSNASMQWGVEQEPRARAAYEFFTDRTIAEVGFVPHPTISVSGASPDGLVGDDGLVEIKCPNTSTHLEYLLDGTVPGKYVAQMQWQMTCTGRAWCDFVSFDPRLPPALSIHIRRLDRDDMYISGVEREVEMFIEELNALCGQLLDRFAVSSEAA